MLVALTEIGLRAEESSITMLNHSLFGLTKRISFASSLCNKAQILAKFSLACQKLRPILRQLLASLMMTILATSPRAQLTLELPFVHLSISHYPSLELAWRSSKRLPTSTTYRFVESTVSTLSRLTMSMISPTSAVLVSQRSTSSRTCTAVSRP